MTDILARAEFSRRAVTLGFGAALAMSPGIVRAAGSLTGFHDVRDHGAKGDGIAIDSDAINRTIEAASREGGGTAGTLSLLFHSAQKPHHHSADERRGDRGGRSEAAQRPL